MIRRDSWSATKWMSTVLSSLALLVLVSMIILFVFQSLPVWKAEGTEFVTGKRWFYRQNEFGVAPMIYGTIVVGFIAMLLAAPVGIGAAVFSAEFLPSSLRLPYKIAIELLAGIPSVVYGLLGILLLRDWVYQAFDKFDLLSGDTLLTGGILLAVMILPTIVTLSDDALRAVPLSQRLAARGLGLTSSEAVLSVSLPQAIPGLLSAVFLAVGRSCGEMIALFLVVGRHDNQWPESLLSARPLIEAGQTLSTKLGSSEINIAYGDHLHWGAMVAVGLVLLVITTSLTFLGLKLRDFSRKS